jgi:hypothetical protein
MPYQRPFFLYEPGYRTHHQIDSAFRIHASTSRFGERLRKQNQKILIQATFKIENENRFSSASEGSDWILSKP